MKKSKEPQNYVSLAIRMTSQEYEKHIKPARILPNTDSKRSLKDLLIEGAKRFTEVIK